MSEEQASLMDELEAAWEEHENAEIPENAAVEPASEPEEIEPPGSGGSEGAEASHPDSPASDGGLASPEGSPEGIEAQTPPVDPAPKGLSPGMRDHWKNLDQQTKDEFKRYEERIGGMAQKYAHDARRAQAMDKAMAPYQQLMAMNGGPQNIIPALLQTGTALQTGNEVERARTVAGLISQFKVDPAQVADFLKGQQPQSSPNQQMQDLLQQQLAPIQQQLAQYQQRDEQMRQQGQKQLMDEVEAFAQDSANEFYGRVRESMADIMDVAARQGRQMGLKEAYEAACYQDPEIRKVMLARQSQGQVQTRKRAASSIHGTPGGEGSTSTPNDLRGVLEQAWQKSNRM